MKKIQLLLSLLLLSLTTRGQFQDEHIDLLSKINCELSDSWTPDIDESFNGLLPYPAISVSLMNCKTEIKGSNYGIGIYLTSNIQILFVHITGLKTKANSLFLKQRHTLE